MTCSCGTQCREVYFTYFKYWYCDTCKSEPRSSYDSCYSDLIVDRWGSYGNDSGHMLSSDPLDQLESVHPEFKFFRMELEKDIRLSNHSVNSYNVLKDCLVIQDLQTGQSSDYHYHTIKAVYTNYTSYAP